MEEKKYKMTLHLDVLSEVDDGCFLAEGKKANVETYFPSQAFTQEKLSYYESTSSSNGMGIDIPVTLHTDKEEKGTIFILGESPQRKEKECKGKTLIGVPFAVDCKMGEPSQCDVYKLIFKNLLEDGYSLYLSDVIKEWKRKGEVKNADNGDLLNAEIEKIRPLAIVTFGKKAKETLDGLESDVDVLDGIRIIPIPHPSILNWVRWEKDIYAQAIERFKSSQDFQELKELPHPKMTAEIVAKAATNIIKEVFNTKKMFNSLKSKK